MDTTFISGLLLLSLIAILGLYLYQETPLLHSKNANANANANGNRYNKKETFLPIIMDTCLRKKKDGMPVHRTGPVYNFHQHFNKYSPLITCSRSAANLPEVDTTCTSAYPTGIPEMGWRNLYLSKYTHNQIPPIDPFSGTSIRNFLDNMENVDNIYRKCL